MYEQCNTAGEHTIYQGTFQHSVLLQSLSWEQDKTSPKQPRALKGEPAVHPTVSAQDFPDVFHLGTHLGDTPCLESKYSKGIWWDLELITSREVK